MQLGQPQLHTTGREDCLPKIYVSWQIGASQRATIKSFMNDLFNYVLMFLLAASINVSNMFNMLSFVINDYTIWFGT